MKVNEIIPMGERVLIKKKKTEEKTSGGIYIPESAKEDRKEGKIVSVGQYKNGKDLPLKEGDKVLYGGYSSEKITVDHEEYIFIDFNDILAKTN
jgi:chaperonin GroES